MKETQKERGPKILADLNRLQEELTQLIVQVRERASQVHQESIEGVKATLTIRAS